MAKVIGKEQLCSTDLKYFKAIQGVNGKTLFDRYPSIENIIKNHIDSKYQDFLAHPIKEADIITFYGKNYQHTPQILSDLQGEKLLKYKSIRDETLIHYQKTIDLLINTGKSTEATFLSDSIKFIDDRFVYCYDDKVVLGVWGMQLRDNVREGLSEIRKNLYSKKKSEKDKKDIEIEAISFPNSFNVSFNPGQNGSVSGNSFIKKNASSFIEKDEIPIVQPNDGYEFTGWNENPIDHEITGDKEYIAQYRIKNAVLQPPTRLPWYTRFWNWLKTFFWGSGCLKWLLWLLILLLLLWLLSCLFRGYNGFKGGVTLDKRDSTWITDDPNVGKD
jgi:hypothetical protein